MTKPDFYIVGAPKCGTTAYHNYLDKHPDTYMLPKELHPFGSDFHYQHPPISITEYEALLNKAPNDRVIGEVNVWYLYSKTAAQELFNFQPNAKIIAMLRHPVDLMQSLHGQMVYNGTEFETDFKKAVLLQEQRENGLQMPEGYYCPTEAFYYKELPRYYEQVKRYLTLFPKEQIKVILFDDIQQQPETTYKDTLSFLGLRSDYDYDLRVINARKSIKSEAIRDFTQKPPEAAKSLVKALIPSKQLREQIKEKIWKLNSKRIERPAMDTAWRAELTASFSEDILRLQDLIDCDLSHWLKV